MVAPETRAVIEALEAAGGPGVARFVGGCVRDALLGRDGADSGPDLNIDIDIATQLTPDAVTRALARAGLKAVPTGIAHGTVTAIAPDALGQARAFEVTTLRRDVETDGRRAVVAFTTDWTLDAARRDFRLNALYLEPDGTLHDPTGGGVSDALAGRIVFVGDPWMRIREDYLRVLRLFRFLAGYGRGPPDPSALQACFELKAGVAGLSGERVSRELLKLLATPDPRDAMALMRAGGVLGVLLPAVSGLDRLDGLIGLGLAEGWAADAGLRLAALLPDDRGAVTAAATQLRLPNALRDRLRAACSDATSLTADGPTEPGATLRADRVAIHRLGAQAFEDRLQLAWAVAGPVDPHAWRSRLAQARSWRAPPFPISGADIAAAGVPEGPEVGRLRREVEAWWIDHDFPPDPEAAKAVLARLIGRPPA